MNAYFYKAFGLIWKSFNLELPEFEKTDNEYKEDIIINSFIISN